MIIEYLYCTKNIQLKKAFIKSLGSFRPICRLSTLRKEKKASPNVEVVSEQDFVARHTISGSHIWDLIKHERGGWIFEIVGRIRPAGHRLPTTVLRNG